MTGAAGLLGKAVVRALHSAGHEVTAFDRVAEPSEGSAANSREAWVVGDICDDALLARAVRSQDAVFHSAAILAPASERSPSLAQRVNVEGTRTLVRAMQIESRRLEGADGPWPQARPGLIFPSSVALYGPGHSEGPPRRAEDPVRPTDHYTRHKIQAEAIVRASDLPWLIFRVGVVLCPEVTVRDPEILRWMFEVRPENRLEILHPIDAGRAVVHALEEPRAWRRVLPLGGGASCQVRQIDLLEASLGAVGLTPLPPDLCGRQPFYTDWLDTSETEALLRFQRYSFADYRREMAERYRWLRLGTKPLAPWARRALSLWVGARRHHAGCPSHA